MLEDDKAQFKTFTNIFDIALDQVLTFNNHQVNN